MVISIALWIDQLQNGKIVHLLKKTFVYELIFITVLLVSGDFPAFVPCTRSYCRLSEIDHGPLFDKGNRKQFLKLASDNSLCVIRAGLLSTENSESREFPLGHSGRCL